jgi:hypothetical protein
MKSEEELQAQLATINAVNAAHWSQPAAHARERERAAEQATQLAMLALDKARKRATTRARQVLAGKQRAAQRRAANVPRNRRMHAAAAAGMKPKNIATDEKLSKPHVRKILKARCP